MRRRSRSRLLMAFVAPAALGWYGCASDSGPVPAALFRPTSAPVPQWVLEAESQIPAGVHALAAPTLSAVEHLIDVLPGALTSTGEQIYRATIVDAAKGHTRKVVLLSSGAAVAPDSLVKAEETAYRLAHGSLASGLHSDILKSPGSKFAVQIIYRGFAYPSTLGGTPWQTAASLAAYKSKLQTALHAVGGKLSADIQAQGGAVLSAAAFAPMINARLPGTAILAHFMNHPHVAWINKAKEKQVTTFAAQSTQELNLSPVFYAQGYFGETVYGRVGVTGEDFPGGCRIYFEHPAFVFSSASIQYPYSVPQCTSDAECQAACYSGGAVCYNGSCTDEHGTLVTGMLGHRVGADSREAPQASVYMTNGVTFHEPDLDWLYQNDVLTVNESWSGLKKDIFAQDHYTNLGMVFTQASGQGDYPSGADIEAECRAGSVVCVAGYRTLRSLYDKSFTKNFSTCSRWYTGCDREEPVVTFHGENVTTTTNRRDYQFWITNGTSFAAPAAAGLIVLMKQRWPWLFAGHPHAVRAALMASADEDVHQIPSTPRCPTEGKTFSDYRCPDERDGAGVPDALRIENMVSNNRVLSYWDFRRSGPNWETIAQVHVPATKRLRAVISWSTCPREVTNAAHADLDLFILDDRGYPVAAGLSWDGSYEITEITAPAGMTYSIVVARHGDRWLDCDGFEIFDQYGQVVDHFVRLGVAFDVR